jgi:hypothetical protein
MDAITAREMVVFPAPFGPPITTTVGRTVGRIDLAIDRSLAAERILEVQVLDGRDGFEDLGQDHRG